MAFDTLLTPASFVFKIWPVIAAVQVLVVAASLLNINSAKLRQNELTALSMANIVATSWLVASSNAIPGMLPFKCFYLLPLVPLISGYPLRSTPSPKSGSRLVFQLFSSFTTIASLLALAAEMQYGNRIGFFFGKAEATACTVLGLTGFTISRPKNSPLRQAVYLLSLTGILVKRLAAGLTASCTMSPSFWLTIGCWFYAARKLQVAF